MPFPALILWGAAAAAAFGAKKVIDAVSDSDSDGYTTTSGPSEEEVNEDNRKRILSDIKKSVNDFVRNNEKLVVFKIEDSTNQDEISQSFGGLGGGLRRLHDVLDTSAGATAGGLDKKTSLNKNKQTNKEEQIVFVDNKEFKLKKSVANVLIENIDKCDNLDSFIQLINANNKDYHIDIKENSPVFEFYTKAVTAL